MRVVEAFMAINANFHDVEKYQFKWFRVLDCVEWTWVKILSMPFVTPQFWDVTECQKMNAFERKGLMLNMY